MERERWLDELGEYVAKRHSPRSAAALKALSLVVHDRQLAPHAAAWVDGRLAKLSWASTAELAPRSARRSCDPWEDGEVWFLDYADHTLVAMTSRADEGRLNWATLSRSDVHVAWDIVTNRGDGFGRTQEVPIGQAVRVLRRACLLADGFHYETYDAETRGLMPLLRARIVALPVPCTPDRAPMSIELARTLTSEFLVDVGMTDDPDAGEVVEHILDFTENRMPDDPLGWSPRLVLAFLAAAPDDDLGEDIEVRIPSLLGRWAAWALHRKGLPERLVAPVQGIAESLDDQFQIWCLEVRTARERDEEVA